MKVTLIEKSTGKKITVNNVVEITPNAEALGREGIEMGIKDPDKCWVEWGLWTNFLLLKIEA